VRQGLPTHKSVQNTFIYFFQASSLARLDQENQEEARQLEEVVQQGKKLLSQIQLALHNIAQSQLETQALQEELG
jgi:mediator of RNA polymerase II transcription subunit 21